MLGIYNFINKIKKCIKNYFVQCQLTVSEDVLEVMDTTMTSHR
jgi:hypothetical protein